MNTPVKKAMNINYHNIQFYSTLIKDYLNGELKESSKVDWEYSIESILNKTSERNFTSRKVLTERLNAQNQAINLSVKSQLNLKKLEQSNCFTVCTGHQLCIYGGPAYFFSKILDTLSLCEKLNRKQAKFEYVPVFWMASEDHDFEEISETTIFGKQLKWSNNADGAVGKISTDSLIEVQAQFAEILGDEKEAVRISTIFKQAYCTGKNLSEATRYFVNESFGSYGLLIIDGDDRELKQLLLPSIKKEIMEGVTEQAVKKGIARLGSYKIQATPRALNLFFLDNQYRQRLVVNKESVETADGKYAWNKNDFLAHSSLSPESISPNVFLRPVYQELCLPNVAYVGGAGEISYWLELPELFAALEVNFPIPVVRNSYLYLSQKQIDLVNKLGLKLGAFFAEEELIVKKFMEQSSEKKFDLSSEKEEITAFFNKILNKSIKIDQNMRNVVQGELKRSLSSLENMEKRFRNAEKNKRTQEINSISKIKSVFFPSGKFQERSNSFLEFILKKDAALLNELMDMNTPFDNSIKVIAY